MSHTSALAMGPIDPSSPAWPLGLRDLPDPPALLFTDGALPDWRRSVAVVGTRSADEDAARFARSLASELAEAGCVIVSGGARGIDAAAHEGALEAGSPTVAVLAGGLDEPTPKSNLGLFARVASAGSLISEHPPGTVPWRSAFLARNRIIAALARVVVIVQAPARSGALSTAACARRLGRPVFVVPAAPWDPRGGGNMRLLKDGAWPCAKATDVLAALEPQTQSLPFGDDSGELSVVAPPLGRAVDESASDRVPAASSLRRLPASSSSSPPPLPSQKKSSSSPPPLPSASSSPDASVEDVSPSPPSLPRSVSEKAPPSAPQTVVRPRFDEGPTRPFGAGSPRELGKLLGALAGRPLHPEGIGLHTGLPPEKVQRLLLELELLGAVEGRPGGRFARTTG